jgi:C-terminal processing protease CtpA/Prc
MEPNGKFGDPFEYNMSGFSSVKGTGDFREITRVLDGSPASKAGLKAGDKIIMINGRSAADYDIFEIIKMMRQEGEKVCLTIESGGKKKDIDLILRKLI